jgi:leucyl aminopeptidase
MTESDKEALLRAGIKFMDITEYPEPSVSSLSTEWQPCKREEEKN